MPKNYTETWIGSGKFTGFLFRVHFIWSHFTFFISLSVLVNKIKQEKSKMVEYQLTDIDFERENFLYSPFPTEKSLNPKHWESKLEFWSKEIVKKCKFNQEVCINCLQLQAAFKSKISSRTPKGKILCFCLPRQISCIICSDILA